MIRIYSMLLLAMLLSTISTRSTNVESEDWTPPIQLFSGEGGIYTPVVLVDKTEKVHVFWIYESTLFDSNGNQVYQIFYSQGFGLQWSVPVDIIADTFMHYLSASIDNEGIIHLVWSNGNHYYYIRSNSSSSQEVRSWSKPKRIAVGNATGNIYTDPTGRIYLVYPGLGTSGVFCVYSDNNGLNWSTSKNVMPAQGERSTAVHTYLVVGKNNTLHSVWTEFELPQGWPPTGVYYSQSVDGGKTWSVAVRVAGEGYDQINIAAGMNGVVHMVWNAMGGIGGRYHSWSSDNGETWSTPDAITKHGGTSGTPQIVIDNSGNCHLLTTSGAAWYSSWTDGGWEPLFDISDEESEVTIWIEEAVMVASSNKLHAVFWADRKRLWYRSKVIPGLPAEKESEQTVIISRDASQLIIPSPVTTQPTIPRSIYASDQEFVNPSPGYFILLGAISPVIMVLVVMLVRRFRR
jgi:hypothetical protein